MSSAIVADKSFRVLSSRIVIVEIFSRYFAKLKGLGNIYLSNVIFHNLHGSDTDTMDGILARKP